MPIIKQTCKISGQKFSITEEDQKFYEKMGVPLPSLCPSERLRRRLSWRNEVNLYKNKCSLTGKDIISIYSHDKPYKIYDHTEWYGDKWNALSYGRDFNFSRPFFEQFKELWDEVPKLNLIVLGDNENSDYTHDNYRLKNCYLVFDGEQGYDCYYGETFAIIKNCMDFFQLRESEFCYECINCTKCYNVKFSRFCNNCSDSAFLIDCQGCRNCFACANLQQKQYYIGNKPYSKEEYEKTINSYNLKSYQIVEKLKKEAEEAFKKFPKKAFRGIMNENSSGDNLLECKDSFECYDSMGLRDCKFCTNVMMAATDCHDVDIWGDHLTRAYDCECVGAGGENIIASYYAALGGSNIFHSAFCFKNTHNVFGCVGLIQKQYCIFNKQYTREQYEELLPKIIKHMGNGFGEFFPTNMSAFGYNETVAQDYFPMSKEEALSRGYKWKDPDPKEYKPQTYEIPDNIDNVIDEILDEILVCTRCGKNYKIMPAELNFYRQSNLPVPRKCFHCRHSDRKALRNPRHLWNRNCQKCGAKIFTTYSPDRTEIVFCENCYLKTIQ